MTPPNIPASIYSAIASSLSSGRPACARSMICWVISVGTSTMAPAAPNCPARTKRFGLGGMLMPSRRPVARILSPTELRTACPPAVRKAFMRSTSGRAPASTCCSWRWMLRPKKSGVPTAVLPAIKPAPALKGLPWVAPARPPRKPPPIVAAISGTV